MEDLSRLVERFESATRRDRNYSAATIKTYHSWLSRLAAWSEAHPAGADTLEQLLSEERLFAFRDYVLGANARPRTNNGCTAALKAFCGWLEQVRLLNHNPARALNRVKLDEPRRHLISDAELWAMIAAADRIPNERRALLASAMLNVATHTGVRRSELIGLTVGDYHPGERRLHIKRRKGGKVGDVWLCASAHEVLMRYLAAHPATPTSADTPMWMYSANRHIGFGGFLTLAWQAWVIAGLNRDRRFTCHSFRHAFATRLIALGDVATVSRLMGHSRISTTVDNYLHPDTSRLRALADLSDQGFAVTRSAPPTPPAPPAAPLPEPESALRIEPPTMRPVAAPPARQRTDLRRRRY